MTSSHASSPLQSFFNTLVLPATETVMIQEDRHHSHGIQRLSFTTSRSNPRPLAAARWQTSEDSLSQEASNGVSSPAALPPSPPQRRRKQSNKTSRRRSPSPPEEPSRWDDSCKAPTSPTLPPKPPTRIDECPSKVARRASGAA